MEKSIRKICIITGTRAEYGLLKFLIKEIAFSQKLQLQVVVTGSHLSPEFGYTYNEIKNDGIKIDKKVEILLSSDTSAGIAKSMGVCLIGFADVFTELEPDIIILLGDRFEAFSVAASATCFQIPIMHIHGGESTLGAIDEAFRHSITKMSHLHCVATNEYRNRVIQMGENPNRVFNTGGLGAANIKKLRLLKKTELEKKLNFKFGKKNILFTFHPLTLDNTTENQISEILLALSKYRETKIIITLPNADNGGRIIIKKLNEFVCKNPNAHLFSSLGHLNYLSCLKYIDIVLGNSSSGIIEVPTFKKATINIGDRQEGRIKSTSVIDCSPEKISIINAIEYSYTDQFKKILNNTKNLYAKVGTLQKIIKILENAKLNNLLKKEFHDQII